MARAEAQEDKTKCGGAFQKSSVSSTCTPLAKENQYQAQHQCIVFSWKWGRGHTSKQIVQPSAVVRGEDIVDDSIRNELSETEKEQLD